MTEVTTETEPVVKCQLCKRWVKDDVEGRFNHAWDVHAKTIVAAFFPKIYSEKVREVVEALESKYRYEKS